MAHDRRAVRARWASPAHFSPGQAAADELDPGDFIRPAVVLDVRAEAARNAEFALDIPWIRQWETAFGPILPSSAVIMWTGFEDKWHDPPAYLNRDAEGVCTTRASAPRRPAGSLSTAPPGPWAPTRWASTQAATPGTVPTMRCSPGTACTLRTCAG